jgi:hypothetical protein
MPSAQRLSMFGSETLLSGLYALQSPYPMSSIKKMMTFGFSEVSANNAVVIEKMKKSATRRIE